jgi:hypothetical protein
VSDDQSSLETCLGFVDVMGPLLAPEVLEGEEEHSELLIQLQILPVLGLSDFPLVELLNGRSNSMEEMSGPGNATSDCWEISNDGRVVLVFVVLVLDLLDLLSISLEQVNILVIESGLEIASVEDLFKLPEEFVGVFDAGDDLEVVVDVVLELRLNSGDSYIELYVVSVEGVVVVLQQFVVLLPELHYVLLKVIQNRLDSFEVVLLQSLELLDGPEQFNQLGNSSAEQVETAENLVS